MAVVNVVYMKIGSKGYGFCEVSRYRGEFRFGISLPDLQADTRTVFMVENMMNALKIPTVIVDLGGT